MKSKPSGFKEGDTWRAITKNGSVGYVKLAEINKYHEVWHWGTSFDDGSGSDFDWRTSKAAAIGEARISLAGLDHKDRSYKFRKSYENKDETK